METPEHSHDTIIATRIAEDGLFIAAFEATDYLPSFAYSIGLWETFKHPEIICFGLHAETMGEIIQDIAEGVRGGEVVETGRIYDTILENGRTMFLDVDQGNMGDYFGTAIAYYKTRDFKALQLVWTDRKDLFPWDVGFEEEFRFRQPLLDRNMDFKFFEPKNLGVYSSRQWLEQSLPILSVIHDDDGDWQFLTGDETDDDARIVAIEQVIGSDPTLNEVFDLDYGEIAFRIAVGEPWLRDTFAFDDEEE
jgi:hypothetical protein